MLDYSILVGIDEEKKELVVGIQIQLGKDSTKIAGNDFYKIIDKSRYSCKHNWLP